MQKCLRMRSTICCMKVEKIIMPERLHELDPAATAVVYGDDLKAEPVQRYRDSLKYMTIERDDVVYMILGIENQSHVHYAMPVKNMLYDAMEYANQVRKTSVRYRKEKSTGNTKSEKNNSGKTSSGEFLTGFSRSDDIDPGGYAGDIFWNGGMGRPAESLRDVRRGKQENTAFCSRLQD